MTCCAMAWKASVTFTSVLAEASMKRTSYSAARAAPSWVETWRALWLSEDLVDLLVRVVRDLRHPAPHTIERPPVRDVVHQHDALRSSEI